MILWMISLWVFGGCIFTQIENYIAMKIYKKKFYPDEKLISDLIINHKKKTLQEW